MKTKLLMLPIMLIAAEQSFGQTNLPSVFPCNTTLTITGSPYIADSSVTVNNGCTLTIDPGVEIKMGENTHFIINGKADFLGSASQPILIHAKNLNWGDIYLDSTVNQKSTFKYVHIENATHCMHANQEPGSIYAYKSTFEVQNCYFKNFWCGIVMYGCKNIVIKDCTFDSTSTGEKVHGMYVKNGLIDNNLMYNTPGDNDAIDFDASHNITISNNYMIAGGDDGIDIGQVDSIGCDSVVIQGNYIYNMFNKGISNGEYCVNLFINHNVILGCALGIGCKSGAHVVADHNTLYNNTVGIYSYEHTNQIWGPGHLSVTNCIIAGSDTTWKKDPSCFLSISYSLSDIDLMPGTGNIMGDPMFISPVSTLYPACCSWGDFHLTSSSEAIDFGDPAFPIDPDGSRTDIGRFNLNQTAGIKINQNSNDELIYPNPSNGKFTMRLIPDNKINKLIVLNILGETILENEFFGSETEYKIDLSSQASGIYYFKHYSGNSIVTQKAIVY